MEISGDGAVDMGVLLLTLGLPGHPATQAGAEAALCPGEADTEAG